MCACRWWRSQGQATTSCSSNRSYLRRRFVDWCARLQQHPARERRIRWPVVCASECTAIKLMFEIQCDNNAVHVLEKERFIMATNFCIMFCISLFLYFVLFFIFLAKCSKINKYVKIIIIVIIIKITKTKIDFIWRRLRLVFLTTTDCFLESVLCLSTQNNFCTMCV